MQSEFSPFLTRLDIVLWFLRVQTWCGAAVLVLISVSPYPFSTALGLLNMEDIATVGLPVLLLALYPRAIATTLLGARAPEPVGLPDLRLLVGRCVGLTLFLGSIGRVVILTAHGVFSFVYLHQLSPGIGYPQILVWAQFIGAACAFFFGFFLAFGPAIRDNFRER